MISYKYTPKHNLLSREVSCVDEANKTFHYKQSLEKYCREHDFVDSRGLNKHYWCYYNGETIKCTDEEWEFFQKYGTYVQGIDWFMVWRKQTDNQKENFQQYLQLYQSFWELYYEHYEDLCLYAIMYLNVLQMNPTLRDIISVRYFVNKANEIKGFKNRLINENSTKSKVALLYFQNRNIFSKVFSKYLIHKDVIYTEYLNRTINSYYEMPYIKSNQYDVIANSNTKTIPFSIGINNLSNHDDGEILKHKAELMAEYQNAYDEYVKQKGETYSNDFFMSKFIPYYGRISCKLITYKRICDCQLTPSLTNDSKDYVLSRNEELIVARWCNALAKEEKERKEKERQIALEQERIREEKCRKEEEARREKYSFNEKNKHSRDTKLLFNANTHQYKVNGITLQSVTNFVEGCFPTFNADFYAQKRASKMGVSAQEILDMWEKKAKESRDLGTLLHKKIENYYHGLECSKDNEFNLFLQFANNIKLNPYRTEWAVYDLKHSIAGTIDFVDYQDGEYIIYDWKRTDKIIDNGMPIKADKYGGHGKFPLEHLDNSPYYHYALQLSLYKYILEKNYGIIISDLRLGIFHPAYDKPYILRIPYLEKEINDLFDLQSDILF